MRQMKSAVRVFLAALLTAFFLTLGLAQDKIETVAEAPPEEVSSEIGEALTEQGYRVVLGGGEKARFWFRKEVPREGASSDLGINFGQIAVSTLVGVVVLSEEWSDYRGMPVPAGVYTLRFGQEPADGNHMGVSVYRDFLQLIPAAEDQKLGATYSADELNELSSKASGTPHPAVMALFPIWDDVSETSLVKNEIDQWTVAWKAGDLTLGAVVEGHGES